MTPLSSPVPPDFDVAYETLFPALPEAKELIEPSPSLELSMSITEENEPDVSLGHSDPSPIKTACSNFVRV
jgi:hypothetical protein